MFSLIPPREIFCLFVCSLFIIIYICEYVCVRLCAYVHISLFLPECACTTIIDTSLWIFSLMYCCCVSIIFVNCICPPGALLWLINLFLFLFTKAHILFCSPCSRYTLVWLVGLLNSWAPGHRPVWPPLSVGLPVWYFEFILYKNVRYLYDNKLTII